MSLAARVHAQAKVNLRLKVLARLDTGFHSLETVFLRLDICDKITVREGKGRSLDLTGPDHLIRAAGPVENNLAMRAAEAFAARTGWPEGFAIGLDKRIPIGAGLGGGSADAGAVLRALNAIAPRPLPAAELLAVGQSLGSDVPFFVSEHVMAFGSGRGERLLGMDALPTRPVIIAVPPFGVATGDAYGWLGMSVGAPAEEARPLPSDAFKSWENVAAHAENDFGEVVASRHPLCEVIRSSLLSRGAEVAMLSGSGSSVFGVFPENAEVQPAPNSEWREIPTRTASHVVPVERMD